MGARARVTLAAAVLALLLMTGAARAADGPGGVDPGVERRRLGLPVAVALVALTGAGAAVLRVVRAEPRGLGGRGTVGYPERARREHPPVTERP